METTTDELLGWRSEFPILGSTVYLISHSLGAMPRRTRDRLNEFADAWATRGIRAWEEGWWDMPVTVGNLIGSIIGAGRDEVVMHQNVSVCQSIVLSCFDWSGPRNKIITQDLNFPTNLYLFEGARRQGARVHAAPLDGVLDAIDEETALVSISHVIFNTAYIQDLDAIVRRAHETGALVMADLYQSAGAVPVDVRAVELDFATGGSVKWLCGGPGAGYLYVRRELWPKLEPAVTGWQAHREPFEFRPDMEYASDAFRFLGGTPNIPALYAARSGYEIINQVGVEAIRKKSLRQTARLMDLADDAGFPVRSPREPERRGGTVIIDVENGQEIVRQLAARDVLVDYRPGAGIRIAPHFYTADEELDITMREISSLTASHSGLAGSTSSK